MRKFSEHLIREAKEKFIPQAGAMLWVAKPELTKYLETVNKFITDESKFVINWLIENNDTYIATLSVVSEEENVLAGFYNAGTPKDESLSELYDNLKKVIKNGDFLQIPLFLTEKQFDGIIKKEIAPDCIFLDLESRKGREAVTIKYTPLVHKIARSFMGKSNLSYDELLSAGFEGLTDAINTYGRRREKSNRHEGDNYNDADDETIRSNTFLSFASIRINYWIIADIRDVSRVVKVPLSAQNKEKDKKGSISKNNTISGDKVIGKNGDDGSKTVFDYVGTNLDNETGNSMDDEDMQKLWGEFYGELAKHFDQKMIDIFCSYYEINGYTKMKNKDLAVKYNVLPSNINYYIFKIFQFIKTDKTVSGIFKEIMTLMNECQNERDRADHDGEIYVLDKRNSINSFEE